MKKISIYTVLAAMFFTVISCSKSETYPQGGDLDMAKVNILNTWALSAYYRDNVNETNLVNISDYHENYSATGVLSRSYTMVDQTPFNEQGDYSFSDNMLEIRFSDISSIADFSDNNSTLSTSAASILKLTDSEFRYSFVNGSEKHEFRFTVAQ